MARPRRVEGEMGAYERMEDAFWSMLAEMPFHKMTGTELRARAQVSHSTFYYHFDDLDDLAAKMFARLFTPEVPSALMRLVAGTGVTAESLTAEIPGFAERFSRMRLLAASGSPYLTGLVRDSVIGAWLSATGVSEDRLSNEDRADLAFAFGGMVALFASDVAADPGALAAFSQRESGKALVATMRRIAGSAGEDS